MPRARQGPYQPYLHFCVSCRKGFKSQAGYTKHTSSYHRFQLEVQADYQILPVPVAAVDSDSAPELQVQVEGEVAASITVVVCTY